MNEIHKTGSAYRSVIMLFMLLSLTSCSKQKNKQDMTFQELQEKTLALIEADRKDVAIEYLEQIVNRHQDQEAVGSYKLLLAELYYKTENYESAQELYNHFYQFYPSDKQAEYAYYRAILSQFNQTLRTDCDQEPTKKTIELCSEYLENPLLASYKQDVADIKNTCEYKLINKEIYIFDFYLQREQYTAAEKRLAYLNKEYLPRHTELASRFLYLECKLAEKIKDKERTSRLLHELETKHPSSQYTRMAHSMLEKKKYFIA